MFKKILAVAAVAATAACMSVSAFASEETETTTTTPAATHTEGSVSVTDYAAVSGATQYTVMVFLDSEDGISVDEIYYINQGSDPAALLSGMLVKATTTTAEDGTSTTTNALPDGDYTVRIGNDTGSVVDVDLKVETTPAGVELTLSYGDVNGDGAANSMDASLILQKGVSLIENFTDQEGNVLTTYTYTYVAPTE